MDEQSPHPGPDDPPAHRIVVLGPDGRPVGELVDGGVVAMGSRGHGAPAAAAHEADGDGDGDGADAAEEETRSITDLVEQPAKVMRIGSMIKGLLDEVRSAPLDEASRARLKEIHARSVRELEDGLAPELVEELERLSLPFSEDATPSDAELRIAQAQLVGWLEGLFHGIQTALFAQQMAARAQYEEMRRRALGGAGGPGGAGMPGLPPGLLPPQQQPADDSGSGRGSGPYL